LNRSDNFAFSIYSSVKGYHSITIYDLNINESIEIVEGIVLLTEDGVGLYENTDFYCVNDNIKFPQITNTLNYSMSEIKKSLYNLYGETYKCFSSLETANKYLYDKEVNKLKQTYNQ